MCRIFGLIDTSLDGPSAQAIGERMLGLLRHGGPDGDHLHIEPGLLLGATRLAINDPAGGAQPFHAGRRTVVFNGEIYNAAALHAFFPGTRWRSHCDGEVLPHVLERHGAAAHAALDGMYAVAAFDGASRELLLLRDPAGIKPLYYFWEDGRFGFASEIPALVALRGTGARPRLDALGAYLRLRGVYGAEEKPGRPTAVEGIWSLPPGATLRVGADLTVELIPAEPGAQWEPSAAPGSCDPAAVLENAVEAVTIADVPYCSILSGGLDSSIVTALAARRTPGRLHTFTVVPKTASRFDESGYAREVAGRLGTEHHEVVMDPARLPDLLPAVVARLGQPNADPITVSTYRLFEAVSAAGFKVALTGDGSDEVFCGYDRFVAADGGAPLEHYARDVSALTGDLYDSLLTNEFKAHAAGYALDEEPFVRAYDRHPLHAAMDFEQRHRLPVYHLQRVDHLSAAHAVEARVPFCQRAVRDHGRGLPRRDRIGPDGRVKKALTEAAVRHDWVPGSVARRPKQPFTFSLTENLFDETGGFVDWARGVLLDPAAQRRGLVRPAAVERLLTEARERRTPQLAQALWALLILELWLREMATW